MRYPAYILFEDDEEGVTHINPVYLDTEEDAQFVGNALAKINELLFLTGYEVKVVKQ